MTQTSPTKTGGHVHSLWTIDPPAELIRLGECVGRQLARIGNGPGDRRYGPADARRRSRDHRKNASRAAGHPGSDQEFRVDADGTVIVLAAQLPARYRAEEGEESCHT